MKYSLLLLLFLSVLPLSAQKLDLSLFENIKPRNIGPGGMSGRVTSIDVVENKPEVIYVGTASGGVWRSKNAGITWQPIFEKKVTASIGAVAVQQSNPSVIWAGTGEGNPRNSLNGGYGIYKSLDGGDTWQSMGLEKTRHIHRIIIDPTDGNTVYAAAIGSPWGNHPERGVYKTTDGGKSWKKVLYTNNSSGAADLVMDPENHNKLIAAMWEHKREPWFFKSGGTGSGLYITLDGGDNWKKLTSDDGLPKGDLGRIGIAIAPSDTDIVYALIEAKKNALYKSTDGGKKWKRVNDKSGIGNRPFYYSEIYVDPQNENRLYTVFTYVNVSEDGGKSFKQLMPAYGVNNGVHPDHHAFYIHPADGNFMIDGNDGGLNITRDRGKNWRFIGNLPVAQFYHINTDNDIPYNVYGGMQDNGSWRGPAYVWRAQGIRNSYWQEVSFGDGFDVIPDPDDSRYGYSMSQQGYVSRYDWLTGNNYSIRPTHPDPEVHLRFNWNAAINIDPFDSSTLYFGSQFVHKSMDKGLTWRIISPDLTTNDASKQQQSESGGLTMDATGAENFTTILVIEPSAVEKDVLYVGTDDGLVHVSKDGGKNWNNITSGLTGLPTGSWIAQIKASKINKGHALLVANDYRRFNYEPYAYRTTDYGATWSRIVDKNDTASYALSIIEHPQEANLLFLGTDDGLYVSINAGGDWVKYTAGFPTVSVKDLVIQERENDLVIGTFGRAAWVLDDLDVFTAFAKAESKEPIALYHPPTAYLSRTQQPTGSRFGGDAMYQGENRKTGARIRYYFNEKRKAPLDTVGVDSLTLKIYKGTKLIRTLKRKTPEKAGVYSWNWRLREKGIPYPSRKIKDSKSEPSGITVLPGTYNLELHYGTMHHTASIEVKADPRIDELTASNRITKYEQLKKLENLMQEVATITEKLAQHHENTTRFKNTLKDLDKESYKEAITASDSIISGLEKQQDKYFGKIDKRQGITRNKEITVLNRINLARQYIRSRQGAQTATEKQLILQAVALSNKVNSQTTMWLKNNWPAYQQEMSELNINYWKE